MLRGGLSFISCIVHDPTGIGDRCAGPHAPRFSCNHSRTRAAFDFRGRVAVFANSCTTPRFHSETGAIRVNRNNPGLQAAMGPGYLPVEWLYVGLGARSLGASLQRLGMGPRPLAIAARGTDHQPRTFAKISGATIVASDSMMNRGLSTLSFPHVIFSLGTAPEYEPKLVVESLIWQK